MKKENYDFKKIEKKWQDIWEKENRYQAVDFDVKPKYFMMVEFPYPSGSGLHCGHTPNQIALDIIARKRRAEGYNVLFPMGWDSFGLPTENYAIKTGKDPKKITEENIDYFKKQIKSLGISFDWSREIITSSPEYYKWTQWLFLQFYKHGMAYKAKANINWCPKCKIGLSNEESEGGVCERCGAETIQKPKEQWMLKMSDYSEKLLQGLDNTNFLPSIKQMQRKWIGKSEGVTLNCKLEDGTPFEIFTTCIETIFGITYFVFAPEHEIVKQLKDKIKNWNQVENYIKSSAKKTEFERSELQKEKTGCKLEGIYAINPITGEKVPTFIGDYVLMNYGTGAVMAVPAHDQRDFEFAKKFNIKNKIVITGGDGLTPYEKGEYLENKDSKLINSGEFTGLSISEAKKSIIEFLEKKNLGARKVNYKMRDWVFSRQRYWGEPVPLIYCKEHGWVPVPEKDLPVLLPDIDKYVPTDDGESPLSKIESFVNTTCPICGKPAKRETDVMPNWAGSSWYWLRYIDPKNDKEFANFEKMKYWGKVDLYNGGGEHVTRHLLYARFWNNFFYDHKIVPNSEPFDRRIQQGIILAEDGTKMSKSRGTTVDPMKYAIEYGADTCRLAQMFMGDYTAMKPWTTDTIKPCNRLLQRVWELQYKIKSGEIRKELEYDINFAIKKISADIENLKFNTAISGIMVLLNIYESKEFITHEEYKILLKLLNPFAPHMTEEIWENNKFASKIEDVKWPVADEKALVKDTIEIPVQVNGKLRGVIMAPQGASQEKLVELAKEQPEINKYLTTTIKKIIYIPNRIFNILV